MFSFGLGMPGNVVVESFYMASQMVFGFTRKREE